MKFVICFWLGTHFDFFIWPEKSECYAQSGAQKNVFLFCCSCITLQTKIVLSYCSVTMMFMYLSPFWGQRSSTELWVLKIFDLHPHNFGTMTDQLLIMLHLQHTCCGYHYNSEKMADIFGLSLLYLLRLCMSRCMHSI